MLAKLSNAFSNLINLSNDNRHELYKRKLDAYDVLFEKVQQVAILTLASKVATIETRDIVQAQMDLHQARLRLVLYLSKEIGELTSRLIDAETSDAIIQATQALAKAAADDLQIKKHEFITRLSIGEAQLKLLEKQATKAKKQGR